jgi:SpoVK/Ycf46/Vps4 family AAA+-type ATPase
VIATDAELGNLYFIEYSWGAKPEPSTDFWHSKGFNFEGALERLWVHYKGGIQTSIKFDPNRDRARTSYRDLRFTQDPIVGTNVQTLDTLVADHKQYLEAGVPRTYLFLGMQGVGKSTLAGRMAQTNGKRTLQINARGLTVAGTNDLHFLLMGLKPDFLILDDIDRMVSEAIPMMLESLSDLKERHPHVTSILTANSIEPFDAATLRPGRIDEIVEFEPPDSQERGKILKAYLKEFASKPISANAFRQIIQVTEGQSAAYLREMALELKVASVERVVETQKQRRRLTALAKGGGGAKAPASPEPPTTKAS